MNERIDEIAYESGCNRHKYYDPKHPDLEGWIINQEVLDTFARRIIEECASMADMPNDKVILDHFGLNKSDIMAGVEIHSGGGYTESTWEGYNEFVKKRNRNEPTL